MRSAVQFRNGAYMEKLPSYKSMYTADILTSGALVMPWLAPGPNRHLTISHTDLSYSSTIVATWEHGLLLWSGLNIANIYLHSCVADRCRVVLLWTHFCCICVEQQQTSNHLLQLQPAPKGPTFCCYLSPCASADLWYKEQKIGSCCFCCYWLLHIANPTPSAAALRWG